MGRTAAPPRSGGLFDFVGKLGREPARVAAALNPAPAASLATVFVDLAVNRCNHRCVFCDRRFLPARAPTFTTARLLRLAAEIHALGADSVLIVGDGSEPLLHSGFRPFARRLRALGLRRGAYTNGSRWTAADLEELATFDFVRVSLDAGRARTHGRLHRAPREDFPRALTLLRRLAAAGPLVGASFLVLPANVGEIARAAGLVRNLGAHYLELKPPYGPGYTFDAAAYRRLEAELRRQLARARDLEDGRFRVVLNLQLADLLAGRIAPEEAATTPPRPCLASRLRLVVSPRGCYLCPPYRGDPTRWCGDPRRESLAAIWYGRRRRALGELPCDRRCPYHAQNEALLRCRRGLPVPASAQGLLQAGFL